MTPPMDRSGFWFLIAVVAVVGVLLGWAVMRSVPALPPVAPSVVVPTRPGVEGVGGRLTPSPTPTRSSPSPTTWRPDWAPQRPRPTTRWPTRTRVPVTAASETPTAPPTHPGPSTAATAPAETTPTTAPNPTDPTPATGATS